MIIPDILILVFAGYALTFSPIIATAKAFLYLLAFFVQAGLVLLFGGLVAIYYMVRLPDMLARRLLVLAQEDLDRKRGKKKQ